MRIARVFTDSFFDGFGPNGFLFPLRRRCVPVTVCEAANLNEERDNRRAHFFALAGLVCGTISFLAMNAGFVYLVMTGHPLVAGTVLGAGVLAIGGRVIALAQSRHR
jgi:hypothetical protein